MVNGKSAVEWVMERYQASTDEANCIAYALNNWCRKRDDPAYVLNLLRQVVHLGVETIRIVMALPGID